MDVDSCVLPTDDLLSEWIDVLLYADSFVNSENILLFPLEFELNALPLVSALLIDFS